MIPTKTPSAQFAAFMSNPNERKGGITIPSYLWRLSRK